MPHPLIALDGVGLPSDPAVRTFLKALAQRDAKVSIHGGGAVIEATRSGRCTPIAWLPEQQLQALEACGWVNVSATGEDRRLSQAGKSMVRQIKAGKAPSDAAIATASEPPPAAAKVDPESPLAWLRTRRGRDGAPLLSEPAYQAGERLRADFARSHLMPRTTVDWAAIPRSRDEQRGNGHLARERSGTSSEAAERVRKALATVPPELAGLAFDICCLEQRVPDAERGHGAPQRSGHYLLSIALTALARHYGLLAPAGRDWPHAALTRHWGAEGYRPTIDGDPDSAGH